MKLMPRVETLQESNPAIDLISATVRKSTSPSLKHLTRISMVSLRRICGGLLLWMAALFLTCGLAQATIIYSGPISITDADPTQLGRLSRNAIPQDWTDGEPFPGVINPTTSYHYTTLDLDLTALEASYTDYGGYIQIDFDSTPSTTFLSAYLNSYSPPDLQTNWLGDAGTSGNFFGVDPLFFQVIVSSPDHLLLVLNESTTNGGLNLVGNVIVEAFTDTEFTDLNPRASVPEPATWLLLVAGLTVFAVRRRSGRRALRS
jgi:PEP-CTERM motif